MTITLRQESATGATTKGSALTYAELDNNFVHLLRQGSVTVRGDSGADQTLGEEDKDSILQITGDQTNITTTISSDSAGETVLTLDFIGAVGMSDLVDDTTPQLGGDLDVNSQKIVSVSNGNIELEPNGTGKSIIDNINYFETPYSLGSTDSPSIDVANGNVQTVTISSGLSLPDFTNAVTGQSVTLIVSGSGSATGSANYKFAGGNKTLTNDSVVSIFYDGTTYFTSIATDFQV